MVTTDLKRRFLELFGGEPIISRAPGRINLIGEHTDYNEGFVLPAAIGKYVFAAASKRRDDKIVLHSAQFNEQYEIAAEDIHPIKGQWTNYILGVVDQLLKRNYPISGFNMLIYGEVPVGAGMSSSAAVECAVINALNELFHLKLSKLSMA